MFKWSYATPLVGLALGDFSTLTKSCHVIYHFSQLGNGILTDSLKFVDHTPSGCVPLRLFHFNETMSLISTLSLSSRLRKKKREEIPKEVVDILAIPEEQEIDSPDDSDDEFEDPSGVPEVIMHLDELELSGDSDVDAE
ncbi:hypothetical protein Fcan01_26938 [Folsomia candida]|uniref:Uncharacterized protein n=1 Tax=Folsomia candida TaxID=158441 RepID=A0A226D0B8_FOLCA|nr:hypothetical protein Fcan01_26938 [Folsomia candida]